MKTTTSLIFLFALLCNLVANPPLPDTGKRWVLNPNYSDEFNGTSLDLSKWYDYHPNWKGREPGIFVPEMISVGNGYLKLRSEKMDHDTIITSQWSGKKSTYNIKCAAVVSKEQSAHYGYYECRAKAAPTTMSTTFWFSNRKNFDGPEDCNDKFSQEWDVQECIGREGDFSGKWFAKGMHSNAHYWYTDCDGERHDYRADDVRYDDNKLASEQFDIYGGWWHDATRATYYYNNANPKEQDFYTGVSKQAMAQPMGMNLVHETYPFPWISLPTDRELADTSNYCLYDWVRAYVQVDIDEPSPYSNTPTLNLYEENISFSANRFALDAACVLNTPFSYQSNSDKYLFIKLVDNKNNIVADTIIRAYRGYANYDLALKVEHSISTGSYTLWAEMKASNDTDAENVASKQAGVYISGEYANISENKLTQKLYPNPVRDILHWDNFTPNTYYKIHNINGSLVAKGRIKNKGIRVSHLPKGVYILYTESYYQSFVKI